MPFCGAGTGTGLGFSTSERTFDHTYVWFSAIFWHLRQDSLKKGLAVGLVHETTPWYWPYTTAGSERGSGIRGLSLLNVLVMIDMPGVL